MKIRKSSQTNNPAAKDPGKLESLLRSSEVKVNTKEVTVFGEETRASKQHVEK